MPPQNRIPNIITLEETPTSESLIFLLYGASGVGKTHFACSAAHEGRAFIINIGGGIATTQSPLFRKLYPKSAKTPIITIFEETNPSKATGYDEVTGALDFMFNSHLDDFDTVIVDDMTAIRRFAMSKAIELGGRLDSSVTKNKFSNEDIARPEIRDYQLEMQYTESIVLNLVANCREANKNLICTAHERYEFEAKKKDGSSITDPPVVRKIMPGFTGRTFPDAVTGNFDCTWYIQAIGSGDTIKRRYKTLGDEKLTANTKWGGIFKAIEPSDDKVIFDFPYVQRRIKEALTLK